MKRAFIYAAIVFAVGSVAAQSITTPAEAFNAGKDFGNSGKGAASGKVNSTTGEGTLPNFSTTAPESANYQNGRNPIGGVGQNKQTECKTYKAANGFEQQECDAINFLSKNSTTRPKFVIDKEKDEIMLGSKDVIGNPGAIPGSSSTQCRVEKVTNPATYTSETCTESMTTEEISCDEKMAGCTVSGRTLECKPVSTSCKAGADVCCWVWVECEGDGHSAVISHSDCCGFFGTTKVNNVSDFLNGVAYNAAGARITCTSNGVCSMSYENYYCTNPAVSIGHYPNANSFNIGSKPVFSCIDGGGCEDLEARTK